jgi:quercetin dioxygenase-like cupin family protein
MHRTLSLDMGIVIEGEIELVLDSGETRLMKRGDLAVQRGTNHAWRNASAPHEGRWARMFYVLQDAEPIELADGKKLVEDLAGITRH